MKILYVNTTLNIGSTGRIVEQIANKVQECGGECYIAHGGRYIGKSQFKTIQVSTKLDNYLHAFKGEFLGRHGLGSTASTKRFIEVVKRIQPDIIHLHNIHGYYINYRILFDYLSYTNIPIVWTLHDCWTFTGHCTHFDNVGCGKWKTTCDSCPLLMAQYKSRFFDRSKENFNLKKQLYKGLSNITVVPVSNWLGSFVSDSILSQFPVRVIPNGIDLTVFRPRENQIRKKYNIDDSKAIILGVLGSGFGLEKGRKEFIELAKHSEYQIILVGLTKDDSKGLPDNIIKLGRTSNQVELAELYSSADMLLNPTYNDSLPTTNIEALACGTPVITYRTGGAAEIINDLTGVVVEKGDFDGILRAIGTVLKHGKSSYSQACRSRAEKHYNKDERYIDYIKLYTELL